MQQKKKLGRPRAENSSAIAVTQKTLDEVNAAAQKLGYTVIEFLKHHTPTQTKTKVKLVCCNGHEWTVDAQKFQKGRTCSHCPRPPQEFTVQIRTENYSKHKAQAESEGFQILTPVEQYKNHKTKLDFACPNGHQFKMHLNSFQSGMRCRKCSIEQWSGASHPYYNPLLTERDRTGRRFRKGLETWRKAVYRRDKHQCQKCGVLPDRGRIAIHAHHIQSYSEYPDLRYNVDNGITLCSSCHRRFHNIYGTSGFGKDQLNAFMMGNQ